MAHPDQTVEQLLDAVRDNIIEMIANLTEDVHEMFDDLLEELGE